MLLKVPTYLALNLNGLMYGQPVYKGKIHRYCGIITPSMIFAYMNNEHFFSLNGDGPPDTPVERFWLAASQNMPERSQLIVDCTYRGKAASLFVVRLEGKLYAFLNRCVHMPFRLDCEHKNIIDPFTNRIKCSMHGVVYDPVSGASVSPTLCTGEKLTAIGVVEDEQGVWLEDKDVQLLI
jgi:nitrite reductase/ring-hydroxylating ferredoxin subunit